MPAQEGKKLSLAEASGVAVVVLQLKGTCCQHAGKEKDSRRKIILDHSPVAAAGHAAAEEEVLFTLLPFHCR